MIIMANEGNPYIVYDNYHIPQTPEGSVLYESFYISSIKIYPEDIPDIFYVREYLEFEEAPCISTINTVKSKVIEYSIRLNNNVTIIFTDKSIAHLFFDLLCSDFEDINVREKYPELFL